MPCLVLRTAIMDRVAWRVVNPQWVICRVENPISHCETDHLGDRIRDGQTLPPGKSDIAISYVFWDDDEQRGYANRSHCRHAARAAMG